MGAAMEKIYFKIKRQDNPQGDPYWEDFQVDQTPDMTVLTALKAIQENPRNVKGEATTPVIWESNCCNGACGSCAMLINRQPRLACSALIEELGCTIVLEPLSKFPVERDLAVNRSKMFEDLIEIGDWVMPRPGQTIDKGSLIDDLDRTFAENLSKCVHCGICLEACPQYHDKSSFVGAASIAKACLVFLTGGRTQHAPKGPLFGAVSLLDRIMQEGGIEDCENAGNCEKVCPKGVPLITSLARMKREVTKRAFRKFFG